MDRKEKQTFLCNSCKNLLVTIASNSNLIFKCHTCDIERKPNAVDSLRFSDIKGTAIRGHKILLKHAGRDPTNLKMIRSCPKCNYKYARSIRMGKDLQLVHTCIKCAHHWSEVN